MTDDQDRAESLLQGSKEQTRHSAGLKDLSEAVADAYRDLDAGDAYENLTIRDENLAALMAALDETRQLEVIGERANEALSQDEPMDSRAALLKALIRVGLQEVAEDALSDAKDGRIQYIQYKEEESGF